MAKRGSQEQTERTASPRRRGLTREDRDDADLVAINEPVVVDLKELVAFLQDKARINSAESDDVNKKTLDSRPGKTVKKSTGKMKEYEAKKYSPKGRSLRKAFERPRPDLPSDAPINRQRKIVSITLPIDLLEDVNARCRDLGIDRTSFVEAAVRTAMKPTP